MTPDPESRLARHNRYQREYFERTLKRTMLPARTAYVRRHVEALAVCAELHRADRVLEVGCGMGRYTLVLAELGCHVEGLDLAPELLNRLREFDAGRFDIPLHAGDLLDCPRELENAFDAVIGFFTLHHLHDLDRCYTTMARLARPGGRVVFLEPNPFYPAYYLQILITPRMTWEGEQGILQMRPKRIFDAMQQAGLVNRTASQLGLFPPLLVNTPLGRTLEAAAEAILPSVAPRAFQLFRGDRPAVPS